VRSKGFRLEAARWYNVDQLGRLWTEG